MAAEDFRLVGADGWDLEAPARKVLARFGMEELALDRPLRTLSGGEAAPVALAAALVDGPDLLGLDWRIRGAVSGPNGAGKSTLLSGGRTLLECVREARPEWSPAEARHRGARFLFAGVEALRPVDLLSGGERMRAALACLLGGRRAPALLVLDEPSNHLDLRSLTILEEALSRFDGALVAVSHDPTFNEALRIDRWLHLAGGTIRTGYVPARPDRTSEE